MQGYDYIPNLKIKPADFWREAGSLAKEQCADQILCYMKLMLDHAREKKVRITRQSFAKRGATVELFDGVLEWFDLINSYGRENGVVLEHYIISSGIKEMIEGTTLYKKRVFNEIYACSYTYEQHGVAEWPANVVNYTTKTQYLFRINKGIKDITDDASVNEFIPDEDRHVPFSRIIYFGAGITDIPCMKLVKNHAGHSIAVYNNKARGKKNNALRLLSDNRVNFVAAAYELFKLEKKNNGNAQI